MIGLRVSNSQEFHGNFSGLISIDNSNLMFLSPYCYYAQDRKGRESTAETACSLSGHGLRKCRGRDLNPCRNQDANSKFFEKIPEVLSKTAVSTAFWLQNYIMGVLT